MPIRQRRQNGRHYFQFGDRGAKYFYAPKSKRSKELAYLKCLAQARAIEWSKRRRR